ncbi:MAG TPA: YqcC family protein [Holophaga sp.]|nr:YqcC family protein [Holophaga sp.]
MHPPEQALATKLLEIEAEMKRIRFWSPGPEPTPDPSQLYAGLPSFEQWLQFVFLPGIRGALSTGCWDGVPRYRVGVAALRNYDYHAVVPGAAGLMRLCFELEQLLDPNLGASPA